MTNEELVSHIVSKIYTNVNQLIKGDTLQEVLLNINSSKAQIENQLFVNPLTDEPPLNSSSTRIAPTSWIKKIVVDKNYSLKVQEVDLDGVTTPPTITPEVDIDILYIKNASINFTIAAQTTPKKGSGFRLILDATADLSYYLNPVYNSSGADALGGSVSIRDFQWLHTKNKYKEIVSGGGSASTNRTIQVVDANYNDVTFAIANDDLFIDCDVDATTVVFKGFSGTVQASDYNKNRVIEVVNNHLTNSRTFTLTSTNTVWDSTPITTIAPNSVLRIYAFISTADNKLHLLENNVDINVASSDVVQFEASATAITIKKDTQVLIVDEIAHDVVFTWEAGRVAGNPIKMFLRDAGATKNVTIPNITKVWNDVGANIVMPIATVVDKVHYLEMMPFDNSASTVYLTKYAIQDQDAVVGEIVQTITATGLNPVIDAISKATTIVAVNPLDANLTLSVASGTKSKKLLIQVMGGTVAKTLTLTGFNYVGNKNKIGNSNIFVTVPNKLLIIECSIVIDSNNNESKSIYYWHIEGLDDNPVMNWTNVYYDIVGGYLQSDTIKPELNDEKRPFKDYEEAITALGTLSETNRGQLIMIDNQVHTNKLYMLHPYVDIRAHVRLVESGFICSDNTGSVDIEITGNPRSISPTSEVPMFELSGNCIVRTHTGRVQADRFAFTKDDSKLFVNVHDNMDLRTTGNAYAFSCRDNSWQIYQWNGFGVTTGGYAVSMVGKTTSAGFTGKLHHINFNEQANPVGVASGLYLVHTLIDNLTTGEVVLQGRKCSYGGNPFAGRKGIITIQNTVTTDLTKDNIIVDVDLIDAGNAHAYCLTAGCGAANLLHNGGKIKSNVAPIYSSQTNSGQDLPNNTLRIEGARIYGKASVIGKNRNVVLKDTSYENTDAVASNSPLFTFDANNGANKSNLTIINGIFYTKDGNDSNIAVGATGAEVRLLGSPMGTLKTGLTPTHLIIDKYSQELNITGI